MSPVVAAVSAANDLISKMQATRLPLQFFPQATRLPLQEEILQAARLPLQFGNGKRDRVVHPLSGGGARAVR
jgi:hypothetical protein